MPRSTFPEADFNMASDFYDLGRMKVELLAEMTPTELHQSIQLALLSHQTGRSLVSLKYGVTKPCGPKKRRKNP
jgi:hypothetical protein